MFYIMSLLSLLPAKTRLESGIIWGGLFTMSTIPLCISINSFLLPKLKLSNSDNDILKEQVIKILFISSAFFGFLYGFNSKKLLLN